MTDSRLQQTLQKIEKVLRLSDGKTFTILFCNEPKQKKIQSKTYSEEIHLVYSVLELKPDRMKS